MATASNTDQHANERLCDVITSAFMEAYPDVPPSRVEHMARNFVQVVGGVIDIGRRLPQKADRPLSHMDVANSMVFWCIANTRLEEFCEDGDDCDRAGAVISAEDAAMLRKEFAARVADWLAGVEALKADPDLYDSFIRGTMAMGIADWETSRAELGF